MPVQQKEGDVEDKLYYKWEDSLLWPASEVSYNFKATFFETDENGV